MRSSFTRDITADAYASRLVLRHLSSQGCGMARAGRLGRRRVNRSPRPVVQTSGGDYDFEPACEPGRSSHRGDSPVLSAAGTQPPRLSRRKEIIKKKDRARKKNNNSS